MAIRHDEQMIVNGRLTQVGLSFRCNKHNMRMAVFLCECGSRCTPYVSSVKNGKTSSCGCLQSQLASESMKKRKPGTKHGGVGTRAYESWKGMRQRCNNANDGDYKDYGGRGIIVCEQWSDYSVFLKDMGDAPAGCSIDRIDVNGNYCKENCRWANPKQQARNKRTSRKITIDGETKTLVDWSEDTRVSVSYYAIHKRLRDGWSERDAVFENPR